MSEKVEIITTTREQQQRYLMDCAKIAVGTKGRGFEARYDLLSLLVSLKGKDSLEKNELEFVEKFGNAVSVLVAYYSDIKKKVLSQEDVSSIRFLEYKKALANCYSYLFTVDLLIKRLVKDTDLVVLTIPSHYYMYASGKVFEKPEEPIIEETYPEQEPTEENE